MPCKCGSDRIAHVTAKCSDLCTFSYAGKEKNDNAPRGVGIGGGDYVAFYYCLDCGKIQGEFPVSDEDVKEAMGIEEGDNDEDKMA